MSTEGEQTEPTEPAEPKEPKEPMRLRTQKDWNDFRMRRAEQETLGASQLLDLYANTC